MLDFYNSDKWVPLSKQAGEFLAPKSLGDRFGGIFAMKNFLAIDETPLTLKDLLKLQLTLAVNYRQT